MPRNKLRVALDAAVQQYPEYNMMLDRLELAAREWAQDQFRQDSARRVGDDVPDPYLESERRIAQLREEIDGE